MKNLEPTTANTHTEEIIDIDAINNQEGRTYREWQFLRLRNATESARERKYRAVVGAPTEAIKLYWKAKHINYFLINDVYKQTEAGITDFKTFEEWKREGATIKKGEKAFPIWGQPIGKQKVATAENKGEEYTATEKENKHYPICYVFSNLQVSFIEKKAVAC